MDPRDQALTLRYLSNSNPEPRGYAWFESRRSGPDDPERAWAGARRASAFELTATPLMAPFGSLLVLVGALLVEAGSGLRNADRAA